MTALALMAATQTMYHMSKIWNFMNCDGILLRCVFLLPVSNEHQIKLPRRHQHHTHNDAKPFQEHFNSGFVDKRVWSTHIAPSRNDEETDEDHEHEEERESCACTLNNSTNATM